MFFLLICSFSMADHPTAALDKWLCLTYDIILQPSLLLVASPARATASGVAFDRICASG